MSFAYEKILTAGDMSTASLTSLDFDMQTLPVVAVQAVYTGAPVGSLVIHGSCDGTNFTSLGASYTVAISAAGSAILNLSMVGYKTLRAIYTKTSGTGSLTVSVFAKG